jgi:hypothetical protein
MELSAQPSLDGAMVCLASFIDEESKFTVLSTLDGNASALGALLLRSLQAAAAPADDSLALASDDEPSSDDKPTSGSAARSGTITAEMSRIHAEANAMSFEDLRAAAKQDPKGPAADVLDRCRTAGCRGDQRNWEETKRMYEKIPVDSRSDPEKMQQFWADKDGSHVISKSNGEALGMSKRELRAARNMEIEESAANRARGSTNMTGTERTINNLKNNLGGIKTAAITGACVAGGISAVVNARAWWRGEKSGSDASQQVAIDTAKGGVTAGAMSTIAVLHPVGAVGVSCFGLYGLARLAATSFGWACGSAAAAAEHYIGEGKLSAGLSTAVAVVDAIDGVQTKVADAATAALSTAGSAVAGAASSAASAIKHAAVGQPKQSVLSITTL